MARLFADAGDDVQASALLLRFDLHKVPINEVRGDIIPELFEYLPYALACVCQARPRLCGGAPHEQHTLRRAPLC